MSRSIIFTVLVSLFASFASAQSAIPLEQMEGSLQRLMKELSQEGISNAYKAQRIQQYKEIIEESLNSAIKDESIAYERIEKGFASHDTIVNLSQLRLDAQGRFTENSCKEALSMNAMGGTNPAEEGSSKRLTKLQEMTKSTINAVCDK